MKRLIKLLTIALIIITSVSPNFTRAYSNASDKALTILFTHDLHDNLYPFEASEDGETFMVGGYSRLYSEIKKQKEIDPEALVLDAGDYSMGTLFQTIFASESPSLRLMGKMGYDVTTLGNHEFDFRPEGLADSLDAARNSGDRLPRIVASNIFFPYDDNKELTPSLKNLKRSMEDYGVRDYTVLERNEMKVGIFGLMGSEADSNAPMAEVVFKDAVEESKRVVKILQDEENVDLIICLSHSGTSTNKSESEDEILAKEVPEIDIIVSGHSHTEFQEPIVIGNTLVASSGKYSENLGLIKVRKNSDGSWNIDNYELIPIDESIPSDPVLDESIDEFKNLVQSQYLDEFNMEYNQVLAYSPFDFTPFSKFAHEHREDTLGNLISDSYIYSVKKVEGDNYEPVAVSLVPSGTIRNSFTEGNITVSDVFNASSLGIGPDKISGYPLIEVYLTGKELKTAAEVDASITPMMSVAQLYMSGINYTFNPNRLVFDKITDIYLTNLDGTKEIIEDDKLYRGIGGLYSAQMLSIVGDQSMGILSIVPKTKDGDPIVDYEKQIIYDDGHELKEWLAIAEYLKSFDEKEGIPTIPEYYEKTQNRKIVDNDKNIFSRIKSPNKIWIIAYSIVVLAIAGISSLIIFIINRRKRKKFKY